MPVAPGCVFSCTSRWNSTSVIIPLYSFWTRSSVGGSFRNLLRLARHSSRRLTRASQRGEYGKKWIPMPNTVAGTICKAKGNRKEASLVIYRVPKETQKEITTPDTIEIDSSTRRVPRSSGGEISEIYRGAAWHRCCQFLLLSERKGCKKIVPWPGCPLRCLQLLCLPLRRRSFWAAV